MLKTTEIRSLRGVMRKLERELDNQLSEQGSCCNLTMEQCHTILELGKAEKEINLTRLADQLDLDKSTVSRGINSLVKACLVIRKPDEKNRRNISLSLSEQGNFTFNSINKSCDSYYKNIFSKIPKKKHHQIIESLELFVNAMQAVTVEKTKECATICSKKR